MATNDQMPSTRGLNLYDIDPNLAFVCRLVMHDEAFGRAEPDLREMGEVAGGELDALAAAADANPPTLRTHDGRGDRVDEVVFHPAYREMEAIAFCRFGLQAMSHTDGVLGWPTPVPHTVKYALSYLFSEAEFGILCPVNVTDSTARMLRHFGSRELQDEWLPRLTSTEPDELLQGTQWMTERTGGSDVGASETVARRDDDGMWRLHGHKWFCSNANADCALTLARPEGATDGTRGLGMFLLPRRLEDGSRNAWRIDRLKDKLGSRSMATGEVTYEGAVAYPVGDLDRGFKQMAEMVNVSRLSNAMRSAGIMRRCVTESVVHARGRTAFGRPMAELPLLRRDLVDMALEAEAACSVVLHGAATIDRWDAGDESARALYRIWTPLAKYRICERARWVASTAMNVRGGNGYVEDWPNARLLRDAYLGSIWEGATNVVALDVQRAIAKEGCHTALLDHVRGLLDGVRAPEAKPWREALAEATDAVDTRIERWDGLEPEALQLEATGVADALYHVLAGSLLLSEGQHLIDDTDDHRKVLTAALYTKTRLRAEPLEPGDLGALDAIVDWEPVGPSRLPRPAGA